MGVKIVTHNEQGRELGGDFGARVFSQVAFFYWSNSPNNKGATDVATNIVKDWNSELQDQTNKFWKQAAAIADWDENFVESEHCKRELRWGKKADCEKDKDHREPSGTMVFILSHKNNPKAHDKIVIKN
ncbi:hypothetical protein EJ110_NYTH23607 [Nymphaea thermarum]|nr:hypothetical protein EJ110_NYTH23607 [Nymphaea thermarum]